MVANTPHYLLLTETKSCEDDEFHGGFWRFVLRQIDGVEQLEVSESEPDVNGERLQLLAVIRGLEAIEQPSRVTLVTTSQYVTRGIRRDLKTWREANWTWERFGELHDIKHRGLWQRMDRALNIHSVQCRAWRIESRVSSSKTDNFNHRGLRDIGRSVLDSWVRTARRMRQRKTVESLVANCG